MAKVSDCFQKNPSPKKMFPKQKKKIFFFFFFFLRV